MDYQRDQNLIRAGARAPAGRLPPGWPWSRAAAPPTRGLRTASACSSSRALLFWTTRLRRAPSVWPTSVQGRWCRRCWRPPSRH